MQHENPTIPTSWKTAAVKAVIEILAGDVLFVDQKEIARLYVGAEMRDFRLTVSLMPRLNIGRPTPIEIVLPCASNSPMVKSSTP